MTILVAISTFATVLTVAAPLLQGDRMRSRMKGVIHQRDLLRAQQRAALVGKTDARLRDRPQGTLAQLVQALNLRQIFEAETSRQHLRQAGFRSEKHLVTYLACRLLAPIVIGLIVFIYSSTVFAEARMGLRYRSDPVTMSCCKAYLARKPQLVTHARFEVPSGYLW